MTHESVNPLEFGSESVRELVEDIERELDETFKTYSNFERRLNELQKAVNELAKPSDVIERIQYLERQERLTIECFQDHQGKIENLQNEQLKLQNWRERISKA